MYCPLISHRLLLSASISQLGSALINGSIPMRMPRYTPLVVADVREGGEACGGRTITSETILINGAELTRVASDQWAVLARSYTKGSTVYPSGWFIRSWSKVPLTAVSGAVARHVTNTGDPSKHPAV
jgi:hypothetical protein